MNTTQLRDNLHQIIDQIEDQATLEAARTLLASQVGALYSLEGQRLDQETVEGRLEESEADIEAGRTVSQQELKTHIESWRSSNGK